MSERIDPRFIRLGPSEEDHKRWAEESAARMATQMDDAIERAKRPSPWPLMGYAPGGYWGKCRDCGERFDGDKRASQCLDCAVIAAKEVLVSQRQFAAIVACLTDCADDLESEVRDRWCYDDGKPHPANERRFERDMEPVNRARQLLAQVGTHPKGGDSLEAPAPLSDAVRDSECAQTIDLKGIPND